MKTNTKLIYLILSLLLHQVIWSQGNKLKGEGSTENVIELSSKKAISYTSKNLKYSNEGIVFSKLSETEKIIISPVEISLIEPEPFISTYLQLNGTNLNHDAILITYRTSEKGEIWSDWKKIPFDGHFDKINNNYLISSLLYLDKSISYIQYALDITTNKEMILEKILLKHYSPGATPRKTLEEINTIKFKNQNKAACSKPSVVSRSQWGARPPRSSFPTTNVTHLIVHHEFGSNSSSDWAARVRSVQNFHMNSNGWSDIGYNFLIDPNGVIYEGRAGGDSAVGAHFCGRNRNTMGVCMLGNYSSATPKVATQNSLKDLLAWKATKENINPSGFAYHYSIDGSLRTISGHRDGGGCSACPGDGGYAILPSIRTGVQNLIDNNCSGSGGGTDNQSPTTTISASGGNTQSGDFTANFNDNDNIGVTRRFYQALEKYGDNWYANRGNGFFNDNFNIFYSGYTQGAGNWSISNGHLSQSDISSDNTKLNTFLSQNSGLPYLYEFSAKTISTTGPKKFGLHIMADDVTQSQRGNSYLIWFSGEDNKVRIYETVNNQLNFRAISDVSLDNQWANYKITYSPAFGVLEIFRNNTSLLRWTDTTPIKNGSSISLRTNKTNMEFDDLKVYKFRANQTQSITAGSSVTKDIRRQNGKIKSLVRDAAGNWSAPGNLDITISSLSRQNPNIIDDTKLNNSDPIIYPNPTTAKSLTLTYNATSNQRLEVSIWDITGKLLNKINTTPKENSLQNLNISSLIEGIAGGTYIIKVKNGKNVTYSRILKQ
ncbi:N-acetylmuramoyl-L-alanine amidase [Aquimarina sp. MMG015]|uniref:N-acetylmuramoyl-L-alanine amidase n=1 Tax=unclassified Aquimarina TaxID=2627091 RepID=UPI000E50C5D5|nr:MULTISPECIES: N-acetylmuramoyl-L-alanine amidase [unclassified Aquimarina]AXT56227.1 T9SS C-terminal target domain-containing protein [Aquimarina sp. AD1]MBQ4803677.1 N-acetylmuramoyl-L-alanine amidase [Aquimarina sp. MMG015]